MAKMMEERKKKKFSPDWFSGGGSWPPGGGGELNGPYWRREEGRPLSPPESWKKNKPKKGNRQMVKSQKYTRKGKGHYWKRTNFFEGDSACKSNDRKGQGLRSLHVTGEQKKPLVLTMQ